VSNAYPREWVESHLHHDRLLPNANGNADSDGYCHSYSHANGNT